MGLHIIIKGDVQGVFFRLFVEKEAKSLGLKGFVKNINDEVEVFVEGDEKALKELVEKCKHGPSASHIEDVTAKEVMDKGYTEFKIEYSTLFVYQSNTWQFSLDLIYHLFLIFLLHLLKNHLCLKFLQVH